MFASTVIKRIVRKSAPVPVYADDPVSIARQKRDDIIVETVSKLHPHAQKVIAEVYAEAAAAGARY